MEVATVQEVLFRKKDTGKGRRLRTSLPESTNILLRKPTSLDSYSVGHSDGKIWQSVMTKPGSVETASSLQMARRPSHSTAGQRVLRLVTNLFRLHCNSDYAYHYDVDIQSLDGHFFLKDGQTPDVEQKMPGKDTCRHVIFELLKVTKGLYSFKPIYDGQKNMFSSQTLPISSEGQKFNQSVYINGKEKRYLVTIKPVHKDNGLSDNRILLKSANDYVNGESSKVPEDVRLVFSVILADRKLAAEEFNIRNSFFPKEVQSRVPLGDGCDMISGYSQTIRFSERGTAVVVNLVAASFHRSGPVLTVLEDVLGHKIQPCSILKQQEIDKIQSKLKNVRMEVTHQNFKRKYVIHGLGAPTNKQTFAFQRDDESTEFMTVEKYFQDKYNMKLRYPNLPCLLHQKSATKQCVYFPMECCDILPNQRINKTDGKVTAALIRHASIGPQQRLSTIQGHVKNIQSISADNMEQFRLELNAEPIQTSGRVLRQPTINYLGNKIVNPSEKGTWNMAGCFVKSATRKSTRDKMWRLISFENPNYCSLDKLKNFANLLCLVGCQCGLNMKLPEISICNENTSIQKLVFQARKIEPIDFVVFVLSEKDTFHNHNHSDVKYFADVNAMYGIPTQCVTGNLLVGKKMDSQVATNICLKLNAKLGGVNHYLSEWPLAIHEEAVIVFGADVVHNVGSICPSIAAAVAAVDYNLGQYAISCRAQSNPKGSGRSQEIIVNLKEMVVSLMRAYYRSNGRKPQKILFYRDGVSYGQFQHVLDREVPMMKEAFGVLEGSGHYQPPITFVIVQKRHDVRLFPLRPQDGIGRAGNVPPGTTVDRDIVDPMNFDFYLCSHEGIQGTSRPTHYTVIFDENKIRPEILERFTYFLTHVYARCNRSISIPAPVKYADLLAYRANSYVQCLCKKNYPKSVDTGDIPQDIKDLVKSIEKIELNMFFI